MMMTHRKETISTFSHSYFVTVHATDITGAAALIDIPVILLPTPDDAKIVV